MKKISINIIANFLGKISAIIFSVLFVPLYIRYLGIEAYGLIGFFTIMLSVFNLLDMGLGATLNREMARLSAKRAVAQEMRDTLHTLQCVYWCIALAMGVLIIAGAPLIVGMWLHVKELSVENAIWAVRLMGLVMVFRFPSSLYMGGLGGLEHQIALNTVSAVMSFVRGGGAVFILKYISPTIEAFFVWQVLASAIETSWYSLGLWNRVPLCSSPVKFRTELLRNISRFSVGVSGIAITGVLLNQIDKIILSKTVSLQKFGYYVFAAIICSVFQCLVSPVFTALYPRFAGLLAKNDRKAYEALYHAGTQLLSVIVLPAILLCLLFSQDIIYVWTHDRLLASHVGLLMAVLSIGSGVSGLMYAGYALQLASGNTKVVVVVNVLTLILSLPSMLIIAAYYGAMGVAIAWTLFNLISSVILIFIMNRDLIGIKNKRIFNDIVLPFLGTTLAAFALWFIKPGCVNNSGTFLYLAIVGVVVYSCACVSAPIIRGWVYSKIIKVFH